MPIENYRLDRIERDQEQLWESIVSARRLAEQAGRLDERAGRETEAPSERPARESSPDRPHEGTTKRTGTLQ